jgi:hypothetical protein
LPGWESPPNTVARRFPESPGFSRGEVQRANDVVRISQEPLTEQSDANPLQGGFKIFTAVDYQMNPSIPRLDSNLKRNYKGRFTIGFHQQSVHYAGSFPSFKSFQTPFD